jgi:hypothetical protein
MSMDRTGDPGQIRRSFVKDMGTSSYFTALDWGLKMYCVFFCTSAYTIILIPLIAYEAHPAPLSTGTGTSGSTVLHRSLLSGVTPHYKPKDYSSSGAGNSKFHTNSASLIYGRI